MSTAPAPSRISTSPVGRIAADIWVQRKARGEFPPGPRNFDLARTRIFAHDPLSLLLPLEREHGPIFSMRLLHNQAVFMIGPEANTYVTVQHPEKFHWRESSLGDLIPLLGDGLLTIDGTYHDRARRIMMPAFHREHITASVEVMFEEAGAAIGRWRPGQRVDVYDWTRNLAMRIAMRALLGLDPDDRGRGEAAAVHFERALSYYGTDYVYRLLRGPGSPWQKMHRSRKILDEILFEEIRRRRAEPREDSFDILGLLLEATDEDGSTLTDDEIRDQAITLMFAGHDTTTSTVSFLLYELARHPAEWEMLVNELDAVLNGSAPDALALERELPRLEMVMDETLRLYPPAWIGPRRAMEDFEFCGHTVKAGSYVHYCSWASHRLPQVFEDPDAFVPERFTRERKAALPRGAYIPFGGGSRICIGKRFGQTEVKAITTAILQRFRLELVPGRAMHVRQMPTLSPEGGLEMVVRER
ncbi:MAG: cytochrome P450 [Actinomycetota bacterium]|nr:cytochrome P450 [Actinomycetota bacterium]